MSVWVPPAAALDEARRVLKPAGATEVSVAEMTVEGVRLELKGSRDRERTQVGTRKPSCGSVPTRPCARAGLLGRTATRSRRVPAEPVRPPRYPYSTS